jgi:hypothetical protein
VLDARHLGGLARTLQVAMRSKVDIPSLGSPGGLGGTAGNQEVMEAT